MFELELTNREIYTELVKKSGLKHASLWCNDILLSDKIGKWRIGGWAWPHTGQHYIDLDDVKILYRDFMVMDHPQNKDIIYTVYLDRTRYECKYFASAADQYSPDGGITVSRKFTFLTV